MKEIEITIKNFLLRILLLFNSSKKIDSNITLSKNSKILFIRLNKIGDALVTTPLIKLLKEQTGCHISVLVDKKNHFVFNNSKIYDEVIIYEKGIGGFVKTVSNINSKNYDAVIDLHDDVSTTVSFLIASIKCTVKIGFKKGNQEIYTHLVDKIDVSQNHVISRIMEFAKVFNLNYDVENINIHYPLFENHF